MSLAYLAGFFDGEGCVQYTTGSPRLEISNTFLPILREFRERFGGAIHTRPPPPNGHRQAWAWVVCGHQAIRAAWALAPFLWEKHEQLSVLFEARQTKAKDRGPLLQLLKDLKRKESA